MKFKAEVKDLNFLGLGVLRNPDGLVFFSSGVWPGDVGYFETEESDKKKNFRFAKLVELEKKSESRKEPECPYQGFDSDSCGGCPWMIANYDSQLEWKKEILSQQLKRNKIDFKGEIAIYHSDAELAYRSRAVFRSDGRKIGFLSQKSSDLVDIEKCPVLNSETNLSLVKVRSKLPNIEWSADSDGEFTKIYLEDKKAEFSGEDIPFRQVNKDQNTKLKKLIEESLKKFSINQSIELFSGDGNFTGLLSDHSAHSLAAFEGSKNLVSDLNRKSFERVSAYPLDLYSKKALKKIERSVDEPDFLFLDPPRGGFRELQKLVSKFKSLKVLMYVSCSSSSFSRDISPLLQDGWELVELKGLDFFPQTPHLEIFSVLIRT
jgi:23S rRNA (uracil1939-C5)-methyltransferase